MASLAAVVTPIGGRATFPPLSPGVGLRARHRGVGPAVALEKAPGRLRAVGRPRVAVPRHRRVVRAARPGVRHALDDPALGDQAAVRVAERADRVGIAARHLSLLHRGRCQRDRALLAAAEHEIAGAQTLLDRLLDARRREGLVGNRAHADEWYHPRARTHLLERKLRAELDR